MKKIKKAAKKVWDAIKWYALGAVIGWCAIWGAIVAFLMVDIKLHPDKYDEEPE